MEHFPHPVGPDDIARYHDDTRHHLAPRELQTQRVTTTTYRATSPACRTSVDIRARMPTLSPALASLPDTSSSTSALFLRVGLLEDLLSSPNQPRIPDGTTIDSKKGDVDVPPRPGRDLTSRLETLERGLQDLIRGSGSGRESLRRFVDRCEFACFSWVCFFLGWFVGGGLFWTRVRPRLCMRRERE